MVLEEQVDGLDLLWDAPKKQHEFQTAAAMLALWQDNLVSLDQAEINKYSSMPIASQIQAMMKDSSLSISFCRHVDFNRTPRSIPRLPDWKYLPWLGYYSDRTFPWIYHVGGDDSANGLGWVYVQAPTSKEAWLYISEYWLGVVVGIHMEELAYIQADDKCYMVTFASLRFQCRKVGGLCSRVRLRSPVLRLRRSRSSSRDDA